MAGAMMLLGPSRWQTHITHPILDQDPLQVRKRLAAIARSLGAPALLMEEQEPRPEEDNFAFFARIIQRWNVTSFILFWPLGARLHGLDVEIGHILTRLEEDDLSVEDVYLLAEKRIIDIDAKDGIIAWSEPGNRTRYHEDLIARGCPVRRWESKQSLAAHMAAITLEHQHRHR